MAVQLGSAYGKIIIDASGVQRGVGQAQGALGRLEGLARGAGLAIAGGLAVGTAALAKFGLDATRTAAEFEEQMAILSVAADGVDMSQLHDVALKMGADTKLIGINASQSGEALTILYKAGLTTQEVFGDLNGYLAGTAELSGAVRAAVDLQAASELDLAQATDAVVVAMKTFNIDADHASDAANSFVQAADASVASVSDLVQAMENIGPTAASFGFSLDETNTALAILSTRGIRGAEAGTALKSMMVNIMRPTDDVRGTLSELGVTLYDVEGNMRGLPDIIGQLSDALYGQREVTVEVGGRTEEQNEQLKLAEKAYTQATKAIEKHNLGLSVLSDKSLAKQIEKQQTASALMNELSGITGTLTSRTVKLTEEQRNEAIQVLAGTYGMKAMNTLMAEGIDGWEKMEEAIREAATIEEVAAIRTNTFKGRVEAFQGVLESLAIRAGEKLLPVFTRLTEWASGFIEEHGDELVALFERIATWLGESVPRAIEFVLGLLGGFRDAWPQIEATVGPVMARIGEIVNAGLTALQALWENVLGPIVQWVSDHWGEIQAIIDGALSGIRTVFEIFGALFSGDWETFWKKVEELAGQLWRLIVQAIETAWQAIVDAVAGFGPKLLEGLATVWNRAVEGARAVWGLIVLEWNTFWGETIPGVIHGVGAAVRTAWDNFWGGIRDAALSVLQPIIDFVNGLISAIDQLLGRGPALSEMEKRALGAETAVAKSELEERKAAAGPGLQHGADFIVPRVGSKMGDYFAARFAGGERVIAIPKGQPGNDGRGGLGSGTYQDNSTVYINDRLAGAMYLDQKRRDRMKTLEGRMGA